MPGIRLQKSWQPHGYELRRRATWIERLAWLMDRSIPLGGRFRIGLDGVIGLVPGVGDAVGSSFAAVIILSAVKHRLPRATVVRMLLNTGLDALVGTIPYAGDAFDFLFQANSRNIRLYREALAGQRTGRRDALFLAVVGLSILAILLLPLITLAWLLSLALRIF